MKNFAIALLSLSIAGSALAQARDREKVADTYKWDLTPIFASDEAWRAAKEKLAAEVPSLRQYKGTLASSPQAMLTALDAATRINRDAARLYAYAFLKSDQDTRVSTYQAMKNEMRQLGTTIDSETAWAEPEILKIDRAKIDSFMQAEPKLRVYDVYLNDIVRRQPHTGSESEEKLIADAGLMTGTASDVFNIFADADFPYPMVTLSDGKTVKLDKAAFNEYRAGSNREDRKKVMAAFFNELGRYRATFGATFNGKVQSDLFRMRARHYNSTVEAALDSPNLPVSVYTSLVDGVNANLDTFHRYLRLRKRILGLDELHYYDLYAPLVENVKLEYPIAEAQKNILAALAPLGSDYMSVIQRAMNERWIDLYPNDGKRSGAYSMGAAYDVHPYMLINYNGRYDDMSTLAHELGHTMQSYFSNKTQPYATASYPTFVAEVASTFNEALLIDYMLHNIKDDRARLSLLGNYLESIKGTVFRQTQFAEFELRAHELAEKGKPLTGDALDKLYADITKKYYGHDKGVMVVDDFVAHEWANVPHFYRNYYVFQYATSYTASAALSEKVLSGDKDATKRYLKFLSAGGSKYPIDLLKDAGVDMTTSQPLELTIKRMNRVMDEMDAILKRQGK
ncbi:MAG: oligoendopeptidase [Acidobacteriota bacterium]|jgi:oligoendopeptidase F|nr:oligoendopeptidase [Acidobacteriota bacterium]